MAERTYTVTWRRPDGEVYTCQGLTPRIAFARLWAAWKGAGEITVIDCTPEWTIDKVPSPGCLESDGRSPGWTCVTHDVTGIWCEMCTAWSEEFAALGMPGSLLPES